MKVNNTAYRSIWLNENGCSVDIVEGKNIAGGIESVQITPDGVSACNISVRYKNGMLITPSGMDYAGLSVEVEHLAAVYCRILAMGEAEILSDEEMDRVLEKFRTYGVQDS